MVKSRFVNIHYSLVYMNEAWEVYSSAQSLELHFPAAPLLCVSCPALRHVVKKISQQQQHWDGHNHTRLTVPLFIGISLSDMFSVTWWRPASARRSCWNMEDMEDDSLDVKDDHNHNYCASGSGKAYLSSRLSDVPPVPQPVPGGGEAGTHRGKQWSGSSSTTTAGGKFMDSDSGSESSEVSETDCAALPPAAEGKFTLDSTSKFRKLTCGQTAGPGVL